MSQDTPTKNRPKEFIQALAKLIEKEGSVRARFNRNVGKTLAESRNVIDLFYRIRPYDLNYHEELYFMVATLYHPDTAKNGDDYRDFGTAIRNIRTEGNATGLDKRFAVLLDADQEQLPFRLRQLVQRIKAEKMKVIDWTKLLQDLIQWDHPDRHVQKRWAKSYFSGLTNQSDNTNNQTQETEEIQGA